MLRLPPTTMVLGRSDLNDFERRRQQRKQGNVQNTEHEPGRIVTEPYRERKQKQPLELQDVALMYGCHTKSARQTPLRPSYPHGPRYLDEGEEISPALSPNTGDHSDPDSANSVDDEQDSVNVEIGTPENVSRNFTPGASPSKDDFHFGGFVETPVEARTPNQSSLLVPDDASTPPSALLSASRVPRTRMLPRSPLFLSQNASSSPEYRPTTALSPRVVSRVAIHNTPGLIFSQPARRPPRRSPKAFRNQTNSSSFDSSERASAAYEQGRLSSFSTADSTLQLSGDMTLRDELRGSSLQSSRNTSSALFPAPNSPNVDDSDVSWQTALEDSSAQIISSPRLALPPPFSNVSRNVSRAGSLPSSPGADHLPGHPQTSLIRDPTSLPSNIRSSSSAEERENNTGSESPTGSVHRLGDEAESQLAPSEATSGSYSPVVSQSPKPAQSQQLPIRGTFRVQTPSHGYQVYNDSLPPKSQPQTTAHLPESRHRSRYHAAYTAPVTRAAARHDTAATATPSRQRIVPHYTPMRAARSTSPVGSVNGGFRGLYGGRENGDEERNWFEGVRFNNAETRLWGSRDARNDGRNLRETPEPDDVRAGRRGLSS